MSDQYNIYALYFKVDLVKRKLYTKRPRGVEGKGNTIRRRRERGGSKNGREERRKVIMGEEE
jgi:hypothetical protein